MHDFKSILRNIFTIKNILDTTRKQLFIWILFLQIPIISVFADTPISNPYSMFTVDEITAQLIETFSYTLGIIGTISVGIFSIKRSNDDRHKENREFITETEHNLKELIEEKFCHVLAKIDEKLEGHAKVNEGKITNIQTQITHLKDKDKDTDRKIYRLEDKIDSNSGRPIRKRRKDQKYNTDFDDMETINSS